MLERIAFEYISLSSWGLFAAAFSFTIVGALIAGWTSRGVRGLRRAPYYAYSTLIFLLQAASQSIWLGSVQAITDGYLWILAFANITLTLIAGYFFGVVAIARARDGFGHGGYAVLGFIPIASLFLLFKRPIDEEATNQLPTIGLFRNEFGVLLGLAMAISGGVLAIALRVQAEQLVTQAQKDPVFQAISLNFTIHNQGLAETLVHMASTLRVPQRVNETMTLLKVETDPTTLRYIYTIEGVDLFMSEEARSSVVRLTCSKEVMLPVLEAGGAFEYAYYRTDGTAIGIISVTLEECSS